MRAHASGKEPVDSPAPGRARPAAPARLPGGGVGTPASAPLLALQPTLGNAAVNRLREREEESARSGPGEAATDVQRSTVHNVLRSPGRPMDGALKDDMESRFNADFSDVRLHTGTAARESAAGIGARAYTSGNHVVVGDGGADKHTLAHELTHVIQQREGPVTGTDNGSGLKVSDPSDAFERAAEANATAVMRAPSVQRSRTADAERATEATARTGSFVQRAGGENAEPYFDADGDVYTNSDSATAVRTADGCDLMVSGSSLEYIDANGSISELWHKGNVLTTADVLCTPAGVLVHKATGQEIYRTTSADYEKQVEISAELLERIGTPQTVSVAGVHYKSVLRSRREGWGDGAAQDFSKGDARTEDGWRGMYLATSREHARGYLNPGGVLLEIATPNMRAYDLTSLDYEALGFASPLASARLVKALLGFDQDQDLMTSLSERNMVLQSGEPGGAVEVIVPYGLANARCSVTGELEQRDQ